MLPNATIKDVLTQHLTTFREATFLFINVR